MTCYHPLTAFLPAQKDFNDKRVLSFRSDYVRYFDFNPDNKSFMSKVDPGLIEGFKIKIPCGKCIGCRLDYSRSWAVRAVHEASLYKNNCFVTLTFNDEHLPDDKSLDKAYMSSWMKRFRKRFGEDIRFMMCGEYGEKFQRPHYHILFFNFDFPDKQFFSTRNNSIYYRSPMLEEIWRDACGSDGNGFSIIGDVSFESAAYVGRYVTKKIFGEPEEEHYKGREKEFLNVSRMPGLGHDFIIKNYKHILNNNFVVLSNGKKAPVPRYYRNVIADYDEVFYQKYYDEHYKEFLQNLSKDDINETEERLLAREELKNYNLDKLIRCYEFQPDLHNIYTV